MPEAALQEQLDAAEDSVAKTFAGMMLGTGRGWEMARDDRLPLYPARFRSVRDYARRVMAPA